MIRKFEVNIGQGIILALSYYHWDEYREHVYYEGRKLTQGTDVLV